MQRIRSRNFLVPRISFSFYFTFSIFLCNFFMRLCGNFSKANFPLWFNAALPNCLARFYANAQVEQRYIYKVHIYIYIMCVYIWQVNRRLQSFVIAWRVRLATDSFQACRTRRGLEVSARMSSTSWQIAAREKRGGGQGEEWGGKEGTASRSSQALKRPPTRHCT